MNYNVININPLDLQPSKGIGIQVPFNGTTGLNITYTTKDATKSNILNFFHSTLCKYALCKKNSDSKNIND